MVAKVFSSRNVEKEGTTAPAEEGIFGFTAWSNHVERVRIFEGHRLLSVVIRSRNQEELFSTNSKKLNKRKSLFSSLFQDVMMSSSTKVCERN
jgi:hypothetical protein